jgi:hypothetical protein
MRPDPGIVTANLVLLEQGHALIGRISDADFGGSDGLPKPVGPHFRHVLEHYSCFLAGLPRRRIDYDGRAREEAIETRRPAALDRIRELVEGVRTLAAADLDAAAEIRLECGLGAEAEQWSRSTLRRELQFLLSHTIHHYALIGLLLERRGIEVGPDFGVAPSTLKHWQSQTSCAPQAG